MKKRIVLCADDYGQAEAISMGIISLVKEGRLSAVSCMVTTPEWPEHAKWLAEFNNQIDIGLHFNLTENKQSLGSLILKTQFRLIDRGEIVRELNQQIDDFANALGFLPAFIDGHQHVHQFPVVRDALMEVYASRLKPGRPYIRLVNPRAYSGDFVGNVKKSIVKMLGMRRLRQLLDKYQIPYNQSFAGMYAFDQAGDFGHIFGRILGEIEDGGIVMCHPGLAGGDKADPISEVRGAEYRYLSGEQFLGDCERYEVVIGRFRV